MLREWNSQYWWNVFLAFLQLVSDVFQDSLGGSQAAKETCVTRYVGREVTELVCCFHAGYALTTPDVAKRYVCMNFSVLNSKRPQAFLPGQMPKHQAQLREL